jgi:sialic acid synthase SpsE
LEYFRRYGFKTFGSVIDESYDTIQDPLQRINAVVELMQKIQQCDTKSLMYQKLAEIAKYNQLRFFSDEFQQQIIDEFQQNFTTAYQQVIQSCDPVYFETYLNAIISTGDYNKLTTAQERQNSGQARQFVYDFIEQTRSEPSMQSNLPLVD